MIEKMWEILTTLTEESRRAALSKCEELGFDPNRGVVSLDESFINLSSACDILKDAIQQKKLIQLPITVQNIFASSLEAIVKYQSGLINGMDEVTNLSDAIEKLNTYIWQYGLHNLSDEVLGYQTKLNQLKSMAVEATKVKRELKLGINVKRTLDQILSEAENQKNLLQQHVADAESAYAKATESVMGIATEKNNAYVLREAMQQQHETIAQMLVTSKTSLQEILVMESSINVHLEGFNASSAELEKKKIEQKLLFDKFEFYRDTINGLLGDSNRTGMAASFERRKADLKAPMFSWLVVFGFSVCGLVVMGINYLVPFLDSGNLEQLPSRLALTAPFIWLGWFSAKQYGYTSRLREDYAYKAASAMSFEGYKREVTEVSPEMLKNLLETAIKNLGENPIRIYNGQGHHASPLHEMMEALPKDSKVSDLLKMLKKDQ